MKRKLISFVCALSMVATLLGGFATINVSAAAGTVYGDATDAYDSASGTAEITIGWKGFDVTDKVGALEIWVPVDTDVFEAPALKEGSDTIAEGVVTLKTDKVAKFNTVKYNGGYIKLGWLGDEDTYFQASELALATIKLTAKDPAAFVSAQVEFERFVISTTDGVDTAAYGYGPGAANELSVEHAEVVNPNAPTPKPTPEVVDATPKPAPVEPTPDEGETVVPAPTPNGEQIYGTAEYDKTSGDATITIGWKGFDVTDKVGALEIWIPVNTEVFAAPALKEGSDTIADGVVTLVTDKVAKFNTVKYNGGYIKLGWLGDEDTYFQASELALATIKLNVPDVNKLPYQMSFERFVISTTDGVDTAAYGYGPGAAEELTVFHPYVDAPAAEPVQPTPTPEVKNTAKLKPAVDADTLADITSGDYDIVQMEITFEGKENAKYGEDFSANYNGKPMSQYAYESALQGNFAPLQEEMNDTTIDWTKFVENTTFDIYNSDITGISQKTVGWTNEDLNHGTVLGSGSADNDSTGGDDEPTKTPEPTDCGCGGDKSKCECPSKDCKCPKCKDSNSKDDDDKNNGGNNGGNGFWMQGGNKTSGSGSGMYNGPIVNNQASGNSTPFTDIDTAHSWAMAAINDLYAKGIIAGRTSTLYDPDAAVTRAEFTKLMVGAAGLTPAGTPSFPDAAEHWAADYIATAEAYGIVTGYTADTFAPDKTINRQEMAAIVARTAAAIGKYLPEGSLAFADADQIDDYAKAPVASLQAAGIINGVGNNMYAPKDNATRAQSAVIVYNYMNK